MLHRLITSRPATRAVTGSISNKVAEARDKPVAGWFLSSSGKWVLKTIPEKIIGRGPDGVYFKDRFGNPLKPTGMVHINTEVNSEKDNSAVVNCLTYDTDSGTWAIKAPPEPYANIIKMTKRGSIEIIAKRIAGLA